MSHLTHAIMIYIFIEAVVKSNKKYLDRRAKEQDIFIIGYTATV